MNRTYLQYYQDEAAEPPPPPLLDRSDMEALASQQELISSIRPIPFGSESREATAQLDLACQRLCLAYSNLQPAVRDHVRAAINSDQFWIFLGFSRRCAKLARRAASPDVLRCGLLAHAVAGFRHGDPRDSGLALDEIRNAAVALNLDVRREFQRAADLAGPTMAELLMDIAKD